MDDHIKFTMECPASEGSILFLDTKYSPKPNHTIHITVYVKLTHTDQYLDWNLNHPIPAKSLSYRLSLIGQKWYASPQSY